jgi:hypothetical protein
MDESVINGAQLFYQPQFNISSGSYNQTNIFTGSQNQVNIFSNGSQNDWVRGLVTGAPYVGTLLKYLINTLMENLRGSFAARCLAAG